MGAGRGVRHGMGRDVAHHDRVLTRPFAFSFCSNESVSPFARLYLCASRPQGAIGKLDIGLGSAWLRPWIAPDAVMVTGAAGAFAGRVFRLPAGPMTVANARWYVVERRVFEQAGGIVVGTRPRG